MRWHLTHGWEPKLAANDSLLRRYVLGCASRNAFLATVVRGRHERWSDLAAADPRSPVLFQNAAVLLQPPAYVDLPDVVTRLFEFYPRDRHFVFLSAWPTPDLSHLGLSLMGHPPLMLRPAGGHAPEPPGGLDVTPVTDGETLRDFVRTLVEAYPMPDAAGTALADEAVLNGPIRLFVGYADGRPVATSAARLGPGIVDVDWVSTLGPYRRRGIGTALSWAATLASPSDPAILIASDDGQPVYESMGYLRLMRLTMWHRPPVPGGAG